MMYNSINFLTTNLPIFKTLLARIFLPPKFPKMCNPILVILFKMRPHYSQSSCENATPLSGSSLLACYWEVSPLHIRLEHVRLNMSDCSPQSFLSLLASGALMQGKDGSGTHVFGWLDSWTKINSNSMLVPCQKIISTG